MAEYWRCKNCGRVNLGYVGTCGCGGLKADGTQASEEDYKNEQGYKDEYKSQESKPVKKKWKCPNCSKINEGDFCTCGYVKTRSDKYIDDETYDMAGSVNTYFSPKKLSGNIIAVIAIASILLVLAAVISGTNVINNKINNNTLGAKNKKYTSEAEIAASAECDGYRILSAVSDFCDFMHRQNYEEYKYSIDVNMKNDTITVQIVFGEYHIIFGEITFTKSGSSDNYRVYSGNNIWETVKRVASLKRRGM